MAARRARAKEPDDLGPPASRARIRGLREKLLRWYDVDRRDLPWRNSRDPYAIWISETMLQQTRVETVIPYYQRFLERFPTVDALATADQEDVYKLWTGLGYYSRARNLHRAAQSVVDQHDGRIPADIEALRTLPGVGRYTAGALSSIAFDRPAAAVDGNVIRVLTRVLGIRADTSQKRVIERLWDEAGRLAKGLRPGDLNQALMEFGATICTPKSPRCESGCPLARSCIARRDALVSALPNKPKRQKPRSVTAVVAWLPRGRTILAVKRPATGLLANLWDLPGGEVAGGVEPRDALGLLLRERIGLEALLPVFAGEVEHVFTHIRMRLHVFRCRGVTGRVRLNEYREHRWVEATRFAELPHSTLVQKALELLL